MALTQAQINAKPKKTLLLMAVLRKLGKKDKLEKKSKEALSKLIYSKQKGKKVSGTKKGAVRKTARKAYEKVSGTKKGAVRKTATKAYEGKAVKYKRAFKVDVYKIKTHIFDTYHSEDLILATMGQSINHVISTFKTWNINIKAYSLDRYGSDRTRDVYYMLTNDLKKLP